VCVCVRVCVYLALQLFITGALGRTNPTQTIHNWQQLPQNRNQHTHTLYANTHSHKTLRLIQHKQSNSSSVPQCRIWGNEKDHKIFWSTLKRPPALAPAFYLKLFSAVEGSFFSKPPPSPFFTSSLLILTSKYHPPPPPKR